MLQTPSFWPPVVWQSSPSCSICVFYISNTAFGGGGAFLFSWDPEHCQYSFAW